ncbi:Heavy metal transport/detoxification superfamily protein [Zea mays]|uniref:Heavy metal transport/detoxification superfamily protein n=1 Tax=Zea mays TaxID=4577 RepID=A0A1D6N289_MAIZE|nr:Heavy metal transport/detoxification superfamily protein [Zea mays]
MASSEPIECQVVALRVSIHCQGCKKKVKKVLQNISGVYRCEIDARSNKVVATVSTELDPYMLVAKLRKSGGGDDTAAAPAPAQQGPSEAKGKAKSKQHTAEMEERQPVDARVTVEYDHRGVGGGYVSRMPPPAVMSYNQVRPSVSASYYAPAPAPAPAPMPMGRPGPSQGYIDEHYTPSYSSSSNNYYSSNRSPAYEPYYYSAPQPAPYSYQYQYQPASSSEDYYYSAPPQRSAFSPPREGYGDMFNDENANSCTVM